jgi:hypothetical protein
MIGNLAPKSCQNVAEVHADGSGRRRVPETAVQCLFCLVCTCRSTGRPIFAIALPTSAQEYMQPITDSARGMVNTVYDSLLNGKK